MKKPFKGILFILLGCLLLSPSLFAKDKPNMTLSQKLETLGDDAFYVKKKNCKKNNCNHIPYKYESLWLWNSKAENKRRLARNIENRNNYLLQSGLYPTESEVKSRIIKERQVDLEKTLRENRQKAEAAERILKAKQAKLDELQAQKDKLSKKRNELLDKTRVIFNSSEVATSGAESISESVTGMMKGNAPMLTNEEEDKILDELEESQVQLRKVIKEMRGLGSDINDTSKEGLAEQEKYDQMARDLEESQRHLDNSKSEYGRVIANIDSEKESEAAKVKLLTQKSNIQNTEDFVNAKLREIEKQDKLSHFILRDIDDVKKDLKINELEAKALLVGVNQKIQESILGKYIRAQNEKTLQAALEGACQTAKLCSEHDSINNSSIRKNVKPVFNKLLEQLDSNSIQQ